MLLKSWYWSGRQYVVWSIDGEVLGASKQSETQVYSSGGGGYLHRGSGWVQPTQVSSVVNTHHEIWLRLHDGNQHAIQLINVDIPLRVGQRVSFLIAAPKGSESGSYLRVANHSAARWWGILSPARALSGWPPFTHRGRRIVIPVVAGIAVYWVLSHVWPAMAAPAAWNTGIVLLVGLTLKRWISKAVAERSLTSHLNVVTQDLFRTRGEQVR